MNKRGSTAKKKSLKNELKKAITNYNKRLARAIKNTDPLFIDYLPKKRTLKEATELSERQQKQLIKDLDKFRGKGFDIQVVERATGEKKQLIATRAEIAILKREYRKKVVSVENTRKMVESKRKIRGIFPTNEFAELRTPTFEKFVNKYRKEGYKVEKDERLLAWQANYINKIKEGMFVAEQSGILNKEMQELVNELIDLISHIDPEKFYLAQLIAPEYHIRNISDVYSITPTDTDVLEEMITFWSDYS